MSAERWNEVIARIGGAGPERVDDLTARLAPPARAPGRDLFPPARAALAPDTPMARPDAVAVGYRVTAPLPDIVDRALRLAAFALEHDAEIVILSHIDESGFERFGFRVERVAGADEAGRAACEAQLRRFWNIDLVL